MQIVQVSPALLGCIHRVHQCKCAGSLCYFADVSKIGQYTAGCSAFCPLCCFVFGALYLNMALFRVLRAFLARFGVVVWVCVACVLCVACVALYACGVRRIYGLLRVCLPFCLLCSCFSSSLPFVFPCLSSGCPVLVILPILSICFVFVGIWVCCWVFFFPCGLYAKKGAISCVLSCPVV